MVMKLINTEMGNQGTARNTLFQELPEPIKYIFILRTEYLDFR